MKICGIIAEFNPLHNGHKYLIDQVKEQLQPDFLIVVMSGNYVQRGEVAIFDKWQRTQSALEMGVDLVIELPFQYATSSVELFAKGAMQILNEMHCTHIAFGTEDASFEYLSKAREVTGMINNMKEFGDYTKSYANQINEVLRDQFNIDINNPNQMLGFNYACQIVENDYDIKIFPIDRMNVAHDSITILNDITSASNVRKKILAGEEFQRLLPNEIKIDTMYNEKFFFDLLKYKVISTTAEELSDIYQMTEGLEYRLKKAMPGVDSMEELLKEMKTKRYTFARLRRLLLYTLLNVKDLEIKKSRNFIHILGFNQNGQKYLSQIKKKIELPIITKVSQDLGDKNGIMALQIKVDNFIAYLTNKEQNFKRKPEMEL